MNPHPLDTHFRLRDERVARFADEYTKLTNRWRELIQEEAPLIDQQHEAGRQVYAILEDRAQNLLKHPKIWAEVQTFVSEMAEHEPQEFEVTKDHLQGNFWFIRHMPFSIQIYSFAEKHYIVDGDPGTKNSFHARVLPHTMWKIEWKDYDTYDAFFRDIRKPMLMTPLVDYIHTNATLFETLLQAYPQELVVRMADKPYVRLALLIHDELICLFWATIWFDAYLKPVTSRIPYQRP